MPPLKVLVADDEPPARRKLIRFLQSEPEVELCAEAGTVAETVAAIRLHRPDIVFLDVQMPDGEGFDVVRALPREDETGIVFVTAHDHYALRAFEVHALDYLLKPVDPKRFEAVLRHARRRIERAREPRIQQKLEVLLRELENRPQYPARLLLDVGEKSIFVSTAAIDCVESARNYLNIHAQGQVHTIRGSLEGFVSQLDPEKFVRISRSQVVNLDSIREMLPWFHGEYRVVLKNNLTLTWTRRFSPGKTWSDKAWPGKTSPTPPK